MAFTAYHNVDGSNGVDVELLAPGDNANSIQSILITNVDNADVTVSLFLQNSPTAASATTIYILNTLTVPQNVSLLLDDKALLGFDNSNSGYGLYITVGSSDTVDVLINV